MMYPNNNIVIYHTVSFWCECSALMIILATDQVEFSNVIAEYAIRIVYILVSTYHD